MKWSKVLYILGMLLSVVPASVTALMHFPIWLCERASGLSVLGILVLSLCLLPFWRALKEAVKSPAPWQMWLALLIGITLLEGILEGVRVVALVATPCSILGAVCFYCAKKIGDPNA